MTRCASVKRFSETAGYRKISEVLVPPSVGKRTKFLKGKAISDGGSNVDNGSPAKWTRLELMEMFEKVFIKSTKYQQRFVYTHSDDILRLLKLKQYPFEWSYDYLRKATSADKTFGVMAQALYDRFIGK